MVASAEKNCKSGALTFFVQKIAHVNWGKFWIGHAIRLVYAKGFGQFDWYHVSNPDQSFSFVSFQTASCLQLLRHTPL